MNKLWLLPFILGYLLFASLFAVEERNPVPFFYLTAKPIKIKLNPRLYQLCRVKFSGVIEYKNIEVLDCYHLEKKLSDTIKTIKEKNPDKNEINMMFVDENKKPLSPDITTGQGSYKVKSILHFKKNKANHIELEDSAGGYYYYTYEPSSIVIGE